MSCHKEKNALQKACDQVGKDAVEKSLGIALKNCDVHGAYIGDTCPLCPKLPDANGTTATEVEHFINVNPSQQLGTNPGQKLNPYGV